MRSFLISVITPVIAILVAAPVSQVQAAAPEEAVDAYYQTMVDGNAEAAKEMLDPSLILIEDGRAEKSRDEYADHHLKADIKFTKKVKRELVRRESWVAGDTATVSSFYYVNGESRGKRIRLDSAETMVLKLVGDQWKIVHIHWSSHKRK